MKTNLIEVTVSGRTGSGKSEVLEVINNALREYYGHNANITGETCLGAVADAKTTGQTANKKSTVFVLREQNVTGEIRVHD
jgi:energy-coupling factor transporter ATP-binding protein EcfA2